MKNLISDFPTHLQDALSIIANSSLEFDSKHSIANVVITGLGGSGISGTVIAEMANSISSVPVIVNKNYNLPHFVNEQTLIIACSYSGNTEETLEAVKLALAKNAQIACITSGGELLNIAKEHKLKVLQMPAGNPPRSMMAYSFVFLSYYLHKFSIAPLQFNEGTLEAIDLLKKERQTILKEAETLAKNIEDSIPIIYAINGNLGIATRWRQQLNENAKMLAWEAEIPEMNHNELVGWEGGDKRFSAIYLRHKSDYSRNQKRVEINQAIIGEKTDKIYEVWSQGKHTEAKALYLIHFGDWVSYFLSELNQVDIIDIKSIDLLKAELSKIPMHE